MIDFLEEFAQPPISWGELCRGEICELILPNIVNGDVKYVWTNPSILWHPEHEYLCAVRLMTTPWKYNSLSLLTIAKIDLNGVPSAIKQLKPPAADREFIQDAPIVHNGAHDCRLFSVNNQLFGTATIWDNTAQCVREDGSTVARIGLIRISPELTWEKTIMLPSLFGGVEKNWMPIENELSWLYLPPRNIFCAHDAEKRAIKFKQVGRGHEIMEYARGSTQLVNISGNRLLGVVHEAAWPVFHEKIFAYRLRYAHRFVVYDRETKNLLGFSPLFYFVSPNCVEFAAGLTLTAEKDRVVISFGYRDISAWLATADLDAVMRSIHLIF
jgi:hypothetical protein